jgi:hypothetical protein
MKKIKELFINADDWIGYNLPVLYVLYKTVWVLAICWITIYLLIWVLRFVFWCSLIWPWMD